MKKLFLLATLSIAASAFGATLGGVVEFTLPPQWKEAPVNQPSPFPTVRFVPLDERNSEMLVTLMPNEVAKIADAASLRAFHRVLSQWLMSSPDQAVSLTELKVTGGLAVYATFEDPDLVGKPPKRGSFKVAIPTAIWLRPDIVLHVTLFTEAKTGTDVDEGLQILRSAKVINHPVPRSLARPAPSRAGAIAIRGVDAVLILPDRNFKPANFPDRGNGYFSYVDGSGVALSGWLDDAADYPGFRSFWAKEKSAQEKGADLKLEDEKIKMIGSWSVVTYTIKIGDLVQKNLRACCVVGKTWADLHLSTRVSEGRSADLDAVLKATELRKM